LTGAEKLEPDWKIQMTRRAGIFLLEDEFGGPRVRRVTDTELQAAAYSSVTGRVICTVNRPVSFKKKIGPVYW
jgi:hypothetical protein